MKARHVLNRMFPRFGSQLGTDFRGALIIAEKLLHLPFHKRRAAYVSAAGLATGVVLASAFDRRITATATKLSGPWVRQVNRIGHLYQTPGLILGTASGLYLYGIAANHAKTRRMGVEIVEAYAAAFIGTEILKHLLGRSRPFLNQGPYTFGGLRLRYRHTSFPSGDVAAAFSLSSVLALESQSAPLAAVCYALASLTAFQRISTNQHWFSDTVASAIWGTASGFAVVNLNRIKE
ncbi:MAG TPA: phosphatase PAP2 family protein [bacterium]|jgi:membrane-associated phospholipid phosphatase